MFILNGKETGHVITNEIEAVIDVDILNGYVGAWREVRSRHPELLFIDIQTDPEKGLQLARKTLASFPDTAVFMISSQKDPDLILNSFRIGVADYLVFPNGRQNPLPHAIERALNRTGNAGKQAEIISFFSLNGGQGITSLAVNVADHIHQASKERVLLLDLNLYMGFIPIHLNFECTYTPFEMIRDISRMDENLLFSSLNKHPRGFYIMAAPDGVSDAVRVTRENITHILNVLKPYFDYLIIDLPHDLSDRTLAVLDETEHIFLTIQQNFTVIKSTQKALHFFQELNYGQDKVKILLNRYVKNNELTPQDMEIVFKQPVYGIIEDGGRVMQKAINQGRTLAEAYPRSRLNKRIETLSVKMAGLEKRKKRSWLTGIFS